MVVRWIILLHMLPCEVLIALFADEEEEFVHYLENISSEVSFKKWYFGHFIS